MPPSADTSTSGSALRLLQTVNGQIAELIALLCAGGEAVLSLPVPGREKMGDGTLAACALHTAERYQLIAEFLQAADQMPSPGAGQGHSRHRIPRFLARGHGRGGDPETREEHGTHDSVDTAEDVGLDGLLERLSAARDAFGVLTDVTDARLENVPPAGSFKFCDGQRTLQQVVAGLLKHQGHQLDAIKAAIA